LGTPVRDPNRMVLSIREFCEQRCSEKLHFCFESHLRVYRENVYYFERKEGRMEGKKEGCPW
jgi:hypothetical protein